MNRTEALDSVRSAAEALIGETLLTPALRRPNRVVAVTEEGITVQAKATHVVPWDAVNRVVDDLFERGEIKSEELRLERFFGDFQSAFIYTLLDRMPFAQADVDGRTMRLHLVETSPPIILTQRRHELVSADEIGVWYRFGRDYSNLIIPGSPFVYYEPEERDSSGLTVGQVYFGAGVIGGVQPDPNSDLHRFAEILEYEEFRLPVPLRDGSTRFIETPDGRTPALRQPVRKLDRAVYVRMMELGGGRASTPSHGSPAEIIAAFDREFHSPTAQTVKVYVNHVRRATALSNALKQRVNYRCQLCNVEGFIQKNGVRHAEAHYIGEVHEIDPGLRPSSNVMVLCPSCHLKMHYAPVKISRTMTGWRIGLEGRDVEVRTVWE